MRSTRKALTPPGRGQAASVDQCVSGDLCERVVKLPPELLTAPEVGPSQ